MLRKIGLDMCIVSTETNPVVAARAAKLRLPVFQACTNKAQFVRDFMAQRQISPADTAFVGNDINDLEAMKSVGIRVCPADAYPDILTIANVRLTKTGGHGAVRELC